MNQSSLVSSSEAHQLSLEADEPGYYSYWAEGRGCGTGAVGWFARAEDAEAHARASFDRAFVAYRNVTDRPTVDRVGVRLLVPGKDRGAWRDLSQEDRNLYSADHPWNVLGMRP